jgi:phage gp46-like protein
MLKLVQTDNGIFDLAFREATDSEDVDVATLIYAVIFTDSKAPEAAEADAFNQRGWWANPLAGTGLWWIRRKPLTDEIRRDAENMIRDALLAHIPGLASVVVNPVISAQASGNVSRVMLNVTGQHNGHEFIVTVPL